MTLLTRQTWVCAPLCAYHDVYIYVNWIYTYSARFDRHAVLVGKEAAAATAAVAATSTEYNRREIKCYHKYTHTFEILMQFYYNLVWPLEINAVKAHNYIS